MKYYLVLSQVTVDSQCVTQLRCESGQGIISNVSDCFGTPAQMYALLYQPFDSPEVLTFPKSVEGADAPILSLFLMIAERIGEMGVKLTATGNLPRNLCREVAQIHMGGEGYLMK